MSQLDLEGLLTPAALLGAAVYGIVILRVARLCAQSNTLFRCVRRVLLVAGLCFHLLLFCWTQSYMWGFGQSLVLHVSAAYAATISSVLLHRRSRRQAGMAVKPMLPQLPQPPTPLVMTGVLALVFFL